jgi:hypothetical protein
VEFELRYRIAEEKLKIPSNGKPQGVPKAVAGMVLEDGRERTLGLW